MAKYLYGIIAKKDKKGDIFLENDKLSVQWFGEIGAVMEDISPEKLLCQEDLLLRHATVLARVIQEHSTLPARFGIILKDAEAVEAELAKNYNYFKHCLQKLEGKVEMGIKILWNPAKYQEEIQKAWQEEYQRFASRLNPQSKGQTYILKKSKEFFLRKALEAKAEKILTDLKKELQPAILAGQSKKLVTERLIMNGSFLIFREKAKDFIHHAQRFREQHPDLKFLISGPWPPYNFIPTGKDLEEEEHPWRSSART